MKTLSQALHANTWNCTFKLALRTVRLGLGLLCLSVLLSASVKLKAAPVWSGTTDDNWSVGGVGGNWSGAAAPTPTGNPQFTDLDAAVSAGTVTNVVDTNFTINNLFYENSTGNFHTTEIAAGQILTMNGFLRSGYSSFVSTDTDSATITGPGTLRFGTLGNSATIEVGIAATASGAGSLALTGSVETVNLENLTVGSGGSAGSITGTGSLDLSSANIVGGTFAVTDSVYVGRGRGAVGTLTFGAGLTQLDIGGSLYIGALAAGNSGQDTTGTLNLPSSATLAVGTGGSGNLHVGEKISSSNGNISGTLDFDGTITGNFDMVRVGANFNVQGSATGTVDLTGATFPGGTFTTQNLEVGIGHTVLGTLTFGTSLTDLVIGESFRLGADSSTAGTHFNNGFTEGILNLPDNTNVTIGASTPGTLRIGEKTNGTSGSGSSNGNFTMVGGTFTSDLTDVYIGVNRIILGSATGTWDLSGAAIAAGSINMSGDFEVGVGERTNGTVIFGNSLTDLTVGGSLRIGAGAYNGDIVGSVSLPTGVNVTLGAVTPGELLMASRVSGGAGSGVDANADITITDGTLNATFNEVRIGFNENPDRSANLVGTFDTSTSELVGAGFNVIGDIQIGIGRQTNGTLRLGEGLASTTNLIVGDDTAGVNAGVGLVGLNGTLMTVAGAVDIGLNGTVEVQADGASAGLSILDSSASAFDISAGAFDGYDITFLKAPEGTNFAPSVSDADGIFFALRWAGDHETELMNMYSDGRLSWDDTSFLSAEFNGLASIFYDLQTNATYVGYYTQVPEPGSGLLMLGLLGCLLRKRKSCRNQRQEII